MKRIPIFLLLTSSFAVCFSQNVKLSLTNPAPRVGENLYIQIEIIREDSGKFNNIITKQVELPSNNPGCSARNSFASGSISLQQGAKDTGFVTIGPFEFNLVGKIYKSDSLKVYVNPKLPDSKEGFWLRSIKSDGNFFIITEQRIVRKQEKVNQEMDPYLRLKMANGNRSDFAQLIDSVLIANKINIQAKNTSSGTDQIIISDTVQQGFDYNTSIYRIAFEEGFDKTFQLKKEAFSGFPEGMEYTPLSLKFD